MLPSTTRSLVTTLYDDARMVVELADLPCPPPARTRWWCRLRQPPSIHRTLG
ncbi:hypothetical protein FHW92_004846 [Novosphingobium sp. SG707]|nr:hypothetical protein [Novosphingobium sp. SG707]